MTYEEMRKINSSLSYEERHAKRQRIDYGIDLLSKKWVYHVLGSIARNRDPISFGELSKEYHIPPRSLSNTLNVLEENELIERIVYDTKPIKVKYLVTETGRKLIVEIGEVINKFVLECIPQENVSNWDGYDYKEKDSLNGKQSNIKELI